MEPLRIILVAENVSQRMGGEAGKNLIYFRKLKEKNVDVWLVCHSRTKEELKQALPPEDFERIYFVEDSLPQVLLWAIGKNFPFRIRELIIGQLIHLMTQISAKQVVKQVIQDKKAQLVFQPTPNTPKAPSSMYDLGVPVVVGPLKGGMDLPPDFQYMDSSLTRNLLAFGKIGSESLNKLIPGKLLADVVLVGDEETKALLPQGCKGRVFEVFECGIDLKSWNTSKTYTPHGDEPTRFVFSGRLVDWKGLQFLLEAFKTVTAQINASLEIIGDGPVKAELEAQAATLDIQNHVHFHGWMKHDAVVKVILDSDVFVMPSLRESCGNSILEAMALMLPVIATDWGGPARILDSTCGVLVKPSSRAAFVDGLAQAMIDLSRSPEQRKTMGEAGQKRLTANYFDWDSKVERIIDIFQETLARST